MRWRVGLPQADGMGLVVTVDGQASTFHVTVLDSAFPSLATVFGYRVEQGEPTAVAMSVRPRPDLPVAKFAHLTVSGVRDLPLARWEAAARAHLPGSAATSQRPFGPPLARDEDVPPIDYSDMPPVDF